jgi:hypothetical protein
MFMRECGATTDFTTQISIDPWFFQIFGNAFVADGYNGGTRGLWGGPWAAISWAGPNRLLVTYDEQARVFDRRKSVNGVQIDYRPVRR